MCAARRTRIYVRHARTSRSMARFCRLTKPKKFIWLGRISGAVAQAQNLDQIWHARFSSQRTSPIQSIPFSHALALPFIPGSYISARTSTMAGSLCRLANRSPETPSRMMVSTSADKVSRTVFGAGGFQSIRSAFPESSSWGVTCQVSRSQCGCGMGRGSAVGHRPAFRRACLRREDPRKDPAGDDCAIA